MPNATASPLRLIQGESAPADAYLQHGAYVATLAYRLLGRGCDAEDLVQEVFLAAIGAPSLNEPLALKGWLATVTVRLAGRRLRRRRLASFFGLDEQPLEVAAPGADPEQRVLLSQIYRALDRVPVAERLAWALRHIEGERYEQVAALCRCSLSTARRRVEAVQAYLEEALRDAP
jgi:RNA polymerase sigma-70 factor (ECF subfamily)